MNWYEQLPPLCPPADAVPCGGKYYRIAKGNPVTDGDFFSQRKLQPDKQFTGLGVDECIARSISLFSEISDASRRLKQLLGQTALSKFGKVTIDYNNNIIEFN